MTPRRADALRALLRPIPGGMALGRIVHRLVNPELRSVHALRKHPPGHLFQPFPTTSEERYPELFDALAERLAPLAEPRILSFGCATGEEVRALRRRMPVARITGVDPNRWAIGKARRADASPLSIYLVNDAPPPGQRFDAILALAVFRHGELEAARPRDCSAILPFARFAKGIALLDAALRPGGWLALEHMHFRFTDTPTASGYDADPLWLAQRDPTGPLYGPDNCLLANAGEQAMLFRKRAAGDPGAAANFPPLSARSAP